MTSIEAEIEGSTALRARGSVPRSRLITAEMTSIEAGIEGAPAADSFRRHEHQGVIARHESALLEPSEQRGGVRRRFGGLRL